MHDAGDKACQRGRGQRAFYRRARTALGIRRIGAVLESAADGDRTRRPYTALAKQLSQPVALRAAPRPVSRSLVDPPRRSRSVAATVVTRAATVLREVPSSRVNPKCFREFSRAPRWITRDTLLAVPFQKVFSARKRFPKGSRLKRRLSEIPELEYYGGLSLASVPLCSFTLATPRFVRTESDESRAEWLGFRAARIEIRFDRKNYTKPASCVSR